MCLGTFFVALLPVLASAISAAPAGEAAAVQKVQQVQAKLAKVLEHASTLPSDLAAEARHVEADAAKALRGSKAAGQVDLEKVLQEFAAFTSHLTSSSDALRREAAPHIPAEALKKAAALVPVLEGKVRKVLEHLKADKVLGAAQTAVIATMEKALATPGASFDRAVALHKALQSAHDFLASRTEELAADRARLTQQIEDQQAYVLYMMLRQRRKLPMKAQMALLRRHQFKDCNYAKQLLKAHGETKPLDAQLLAMLPKALALKLSRKDQNAGAGHLAAAGSEGRVQIVSSRLKNSVQSMAAMLAKAKTQLEQISQGTSKDVTADERKQAQMILKDVEAVLKKVTSTHDLKSQMDAMDEVQNKLKVWMANAVAHK